MSKYHLTVWPTDEYRLCGWCGSSAYGDYTVYDIDTTGGLFVCHECAWSVWDMNSEFECFSVSCGGGSVGTVFDKMSADWFRRISWEVNRLRPQKI